MSAQSTSQREAQAAASSGVPAAQVPVHYALPPDLQSVWQASAARPGVSLLGADLRPEMMINNVRAAVFPHLQQQVQASMALSMSRQAWGAVESLESTHRWRCGKQQPTLRAVQPVEEEGHEPRRLQGAKVEGQEAGGSSSSSSAVAMPPVTATEAFLGRAWSGNLRWPWSSPQTRTYVPRPDADDAAASAALAASYASSSPSALATSVRASTQHADAPPRFLSSERWLVQRCDGVQVYRVQYFGNGDAFYAQVAPTNLSGLAATTWLAVKDALRL